MTDLLTLARRHDLPPKWDGLLVFEWTPWESMDGYFICPPPKRDCCPQCASPHPRVKSRGLVAESSLVTRKRWRADEENRRALGRDAAHRAGPRLARWRLWAFRCQDCRHDRVYDMDTGESWDLDHTDYGEEGSWA